MPSSRKWLTGWVRMNKKHVVYSDSDPIGCNDRTKGSGDSTRGRGKEITAATLGTYEATLSERSSLETNRESIKKPKLQKFEPKHRRHLLLKLKAQPGAEKISKSDHQLLLARKAEKKQQPLSQSSSAPPFACLSTGAYELVSSTSSSEDNCHAAADEQNTADHDSGRNVRTPQYELELPRAADQALPVPSATSSTSSSSLQDPTTILPTNCRPTAEIGKNIEKVDSEKKDSTYSQGLREISCDPVATISVENRASQVNFTPRSTENVLLSQNSVENLMKASSHDLQAVEPRSRHHFDDHHDIPSTIGFDPGFIVNDSATLKHAACEKCEELEKQLAAVAEDAEYLRHVAIQEENMRRQQNNNRSVVCSHCRQTFGTSAVISPSFEAFDQVRELTAFYKNQLQGMNEERIRWEQEISSKRRQLDVLKHNHFLDSTKRSEESESFRKQLELLSRERNELLLENQRLRDELGASKERGFKRTKAPSLREEQSIAFADAIEKQEQVIEALTNKLSLALDKIEELQTKQLLEPHR